MNKPLFTLGPSTNIRFVVLTALSLGLLLINQYTQWLDRPRSLLTTLIYPLQVVVDVPARIGSWTNEALKSRDELHADNFALYEQNRHLQTRLMQLDALENENKRLRELLNSAQRMSQNLTAARLLSVDMSPFTQEVIIDKGREDGMKTGTPFADAEGIMGQLIRVHPHHSEGMLVSDPSHAIPVQVLRNGLRSIAAGTGKTDALKLLYLPINAEVEIGDILVTSGLGRRFPPDYPVAVVSEIERPAGADFANITARPLAALDRSREVLLITDKKGPDTIMESPEFDPVPPQTEISTLPETPPSPEGPQ
jgi:rod shape-determining protein MreC